MFRDRRQGRRDCIRRRAMQIVSCAKTLSELMKPTSRPYCTWLYCDQRIVAGNLRDILPPARLQRRRRRTGDGRWKTKPARHPSGWNLVVTYIDCIWKLVSDWKLIRDARLHSPADRPHRRHPPCCCCCCFCWWHATWSAPHARDSITRFLRRRLSFMQKFHL